MAIVSRFLMMSLQAGILILIILLARTFLKKYPKVYTYCLWALVGIRLLCPIFIETSFSLQPDYAKFSDKVQEQTMLGNVSGASQDFQLGDVAIKEATSGLVSSGMPEKLLQGDIQRGQQNVHNVMNSGNEAVGVVPSTTEERLSASQIIEIIAVVYVVGVVIVTCFYLVQYLVIRRRISTAVRERGNVWLCDNISSPFVIGIVNPRIILPYALSEKEKQHILRHERTHIKHHDPFIRFVGLICLCLHWWNPLVWLAVHKMNQDMEMFCDETALRESTTEERKSYARTLLSFAEKQSGFSVGLAFGESNTERRVKNIMNKRKGSIIIVSVIAVLIIFCMVAFMTIPKDDDKNNSTVNNENTQETTDSSKNEGDETGTDNTEESTSDNSEQSTEPSTEQQSSEFQSIDAQLELIAKNINLWQTIPDYANENVFYAITDLDQNGRLEVIMSNMGGTGIYTYSRFYEVNEQYDGLSECVTGFVEGNSQPDIIVENVDMYYDATENIFYYIETDLIKDGPVEYHTFTNAMCLNGGKIVTTTLSHMIESYPDYKVVYKDGAGEEITKAEYDVLVANVFKDCDKYGANFGWQDARELAKVTDRETIVNLLSQSYDRFGFYVDYEGENNMTDKAAYNAYAAVLENLYYNHMFPYGENLGIQPDDADISLNQFAIMDIDSDGRDEMIVGYTTTYTAGMTVKIYDFNSESGVVREQFSEFPSLTFYDNGVIVADWSHNHGRAPMSEDFWPYRLYRYDELIDKYVEVAIVDAWDEEYYNQDGSFPKEADTDGDGILYYIMPNKEVEYNIPFDGTEYNEWLDFYLNGAEKVTIPYMNMSLENVTSIKKMAE